MKSFDFTLSVEAPVWHPPCPRCQDLEYLDGLKAADSSLLLA